MRITVKGHGEILITPSAIISRVPVNVNKLEDRIDISTRPGQSGACNVVCTSIGSGGLVCNTISYIPRGSIVACGNDIIINGVRVTGDEQKEEEDDDQYKKRWDIEISDIVEVKVTGSASVKLNPLVFAKHIKLVLTGSGDIASTTSSKFDGVTVNLTGSEASTCATARSRRCS